MALLIDGNVIAQPAPKKDTTPVSGSDRRLYLMNSHTSEGKEALDRFDSALNTQATRNAAAGGSPAAIRETQSQLTALGYDTGGVDGFAGTKTDQAIRDFQEAHGLTVDGIVGPQTRAALDQAKGLADRQSDIDALGTTSSPVTEALRTERSVLEEYQQQYQLPRDAASASSTDAESEERLTPLEDRPSLPAAIAAEEHGNQHTIQGGDSRENTVIVWPAGGGYYRHEYIWDEDNQSWIESAYQWGSPGGATLGRHDFINPEESFTDPLERPDNRSQYEIMRDDHWDRDGSKQNSYPNTIYPGTYDAPIEPSYDNYPVEPDPIIGAIASFAGFPFFSPVNPEGYSDPGASAAGTAATIFGGVPSASTGLTIGAGEALGLANQYQGGPTLEGGIDPDRAHRGVPHPR